jgi:hypothetical protein
MAHILVVVCCHAIFHGSDPTEESHWALQPFQRSSESKPGEHLTFLQHIDMAMALQSGKGRDRPTLAFSGGATNLNHPNLSEGQGYFNAAVASQKYGETVNSVILEELATDTYQNLMFSILKYRAVKGSYPHSIIVITHNFKSQRVDLHRKALRWTRPFTILGYNPPFSSKSISLKRSISKQLVFLSS